MKKGKANIETINKNLPFPNFVTTQYWCALYILCKKTTDSTYPKPIPACGSRYFGETKRNAEVRWNKHNNPTKSSESSKHLRRNINHCFTCAVISNAPKNAKTIKNLEASYFALWESDLNEQKDLERLVLFKNGITKSN